MSTYVKFSSGRWHGLCLDEFKDELQNLDQWLSAQKTDVVREFPLRKISVLKHSSQTWFIKILTGLGDYRQTLFGALKWHLRPSRSMHILKISEKLELAGIDCPKVVLAARMRKWRPFGSPTDILIMKEAQGRLVSNWLTGADDLPKLEGQERLDMLKRIGAELARLHKAGFVHGDCHPGNYYWQENTAHFCYIDNDRTKKHDSLNASGAQRNMISAGFYLLNKNKRISPEEWHIILSEYLHAMQFSSKNEEDNFQRKITNGIEIRLKRGK